MKGRSERGRNGRGWHGGRRKGGTRGWGRGDEEGGSEGREAYRRVM